MILARAGEFSDKFRSSAEPFVLGTEGALDEIDKERSIRFYDAPNHEIRHLGYVFRERVGLAGGNPELTLKFRHPDRYVSQSHIMDLDPLKPGRTDAPIKNP